MTHALLLATSSATELLAETLEAHGFVVSHRSAVPPGVNALPDAWQLAIAGEKAGTEAVKQLAKSMPVLVISDEASINGAVQAIKAGALDYLPFPVDADTVMAAVERALNEFRANLEVRRTDSTLPLRGDSPCMRQLRDAAREAANSHRPVLIRGEPGSGKRLLARVIHDASARHSSPMVVVNCAAVPAESLEGELFGLDASISGTQSRGLVAAAHEGTLFLDEIGVLSHEVQARLLRLLNTGELRAVGSPRSIRVNVRIVASSHLDLDALVAQGRFRKELLFQISLIALTVPPLRDRGDDIIELATWMLQQAATRLKRPHAQWTESALDCIRSYAWPGNVRELENAIERAVILAKSEWISCDLLPIDRNAASARTASPDVSTPSTLEDYFVRFVTENEEFFTETELAEKLGISRKSLWERRQRLNIPRKKSRTRPAGQQTDPSSDLALGA